MLRLKDLFKLDSLVFVFLAIVCMLALYGCVICIIQLLEWIF